MFDAPCGDLNWITDVIDRTGIEYSGGDVSQLAIDAALERRPSATVRLFDIRNDPFPVADVWHCRDCLFHLSYDDGLAALKNFARSTIPNALITTNTARWMPNMDIKTGGWRALDLQRAPFNLPKPRLKIKDYPANIEFPRYVAWWTRSEIAAAVL